ncbi:MAG: nucleotidyltransferase domain-containing protein [Cyanobacteria bacterium P01_G01_bin.49]
MLTNLEPQIQERLGISLKEIVSFCQQWKIVEIALFGSVLGDKFRADSDIDILVKFAPNAKQGLLVLAKIKYELEKRIGRTVDIVVRESIENSENWIRRQEILGTAQIIYEQR